MVRGRSGANDTVTPSRKAISYEPHKVIFVKKKMGCRPETAM